MNPSLIATIFTSIAGELKKEGVDISLLNDESFHILAKAIEIYKLDKDAIKEALKLMFKKRIQTVEELINQLSILRIDRNELKALIRQKIHQYYDEILKRGERAFSFIMGKIMAELRGRIDGKTVAEIVKEELQNLLKFRGSDA